MKTSTVRMAEVKIESMKNRIGTFEHLLQREEEEKAKTESEFMKDNHDKFIFRYKAIIETLKESIEDIQDILEA